MNTAEEIASAGGAYVRRRFSLGGADLRSGDVLTAKQLSALPRANRDALIRGGKIEIFPNGPAGASTPVTGHAENYFVSVGGGQYLVVRGVKLSPEPLPRDKAEALAAGV